MSRPVFISHSTKDKAAAVAVCAALESSGIECWIAPRDIVAGVKWAVAIAEAIERSSAIALVLTSSSNESQTVADEVNLARKFEVPVVSIRVEDVQPAKTLELFLTSSHWFDAHPPPLDSHLRGLVKDFHRFVGSDSEAESDDASTQTDPPSQSFRETPRIRDTPRDARPPADSSLHRELLFGVVAAQFGFVTQEQFLAVCAEWCATKSDSLGNMLVARNWIEEEDRLAIDALHRRKLAKHQQNAPAALWASSDGVIRDVIRQSESPEISRSLDGLNLTDETPDDADPFSVITPQSRMDWKRLHRTGGLGHIWLAEDNELGRSVAVKTLPPEHNSVAARQTLLNEARIAGRLEHPNIVPVYEIGRRAKDDRPYYAMRLLRGETLTDAIEKMHASAVEGRVDSGERRRLLNVLFDICNAVAYAHSQGVCHLDLKPDNVVLGMFNEVNLLDWGLARHQDSEQLAGQPRGTPAYMAPEQAAGDGAAIGLRTDVYGLGAILFEILTGQPPHTGDDFELLLQRIASEPTPSPANTGKSRKPPQALVDICEIAMARDASERYESAMQFGDCIQNYLRDEPLEAYRTAVRRARDLCERNLDSEAYRDNLARSLMNLSVVLDGMERFAEAEQGLMEAIDEYRWLKEHFADNLQYRVNYAAACLQRRTALESLGRKSDAEQMSRDALWEYEDIIRKSPKRDDLVSIYETMMVDKGVSREDAKRRANEIAEDSIADSHVGPIASTGDGGPDRPLDRWVLPASLHAVLFATEALQSGAIQIDQLQNAVREMLGNQSVSLDQHLISSGVLNQASHDQVTASMREVIRGSNVAARIAQVQESTNEAVDQSSVRTMLPATNDERTETISAPDDESFSGRLTTGTITSLGNFVSESFEPESWHYTKIERFEIMRTIGQGGWGRVSLARDREALRYAAVKELARELMYDTRMVERFYFEARFAGSIEIQGSPPVYAIGQFPDGRPFYAMRYVDGMSLDEKLESRKDFSLPDAVRSLVRVADCLHAAHGHGFIHCDVKPKHILVDQHGATYFTDWGLVTSFKSPRAYSNRFMSQLAASAPIQQNTVIGTPAYMSPEQASGKTDQLGPATDIYALGATLYFVLAGQPPHRHPGSISDTLRSVIESDAPRPSQVAEDWVVPKRLESICMKALSRDPENRYPTAKEFGLALTDWIASGSNQGWFRRLTRRKR